MSIAKNGFQTNNPSILHIHMHMFMTILKMSHMFDNKGMTEDT